jgi:two-component system, chemotaxis family, chemotaxis protein CheY
MPGLDGHGVLAAIRQIEESQGIRGLDRAKVIMTTASSDRKDVATAFRSECDAYLIKPIDEIQLKLRLGELGLLS